MSFSTLKDFSKVSENWYRGQFIDLECRNCSKLEIHKIFVATRYESTNWTLEIFAKKDGSQSSHNWNSVANERITKSPSYYDKPQKESLAGIELKEPITLERGKKIGLHFWSTGAKSDSLAMTRTAEFANREGQYLVLTNHYYCSSKFQFQNKSCKDKYTIISVFDFDVC